MKSAYILPAVALLLAACAAPDPHKVRREEADRFLESCRVERTEGEAHQAPLTLTQCLQLAEIGNPKLKTAAIEKEVARLLNQAALGALFLPRVDLTLTAFDRSNNPTMKFGGGKVQLSDKDLRLSKTEITLPILDLYSHFLLAQTRRGREIAAYAETLVGLRVRTLVIARYGALVALEAATPALERNRARLQAAADRAVRLAEESLALPTAAEGARRALAVADHRLAAHRRDVQAARRDLEDTLGLAPVGVIRVADRFQLQPPAGDLPSLITTALLERPDLYLADRTVLLARERVRAAVADLLPRILGIATLETTTNWADVHKHWATGSISLVGNLFEGFAGLARKGEQEKRLEIEKIRRRELYGAVVLQVVEAWNELTAAREDLDRARQELDLARRELRRARLLHGEGYVDNADLAAAAAAAAGAEAVAAGARVRVTTSVAMLQLATGQGKKQSR